MDVCSAPTEVERRNEVCEAGSPLALDNGEFTVNEEVDNFKWFTFDEARANIKKNSLAERFLLHYLDHLVK